MLSFPLTSIETKNEQLNKQVYDSMKESFFFLLAQPFYVTLKNSHSEGRVGQIERVALTLIHYHVSDRQQGSAASLLLCDDLEGPGAGGGREAPRGRGVYVQLLPFTLLHSRN